jgi:hypothetical protein
LGGASSLEQRFRPYLASAVSTIFPMVVLSREVATEPAATGNEAGKERVCGADGASAREKVARADDGQPASRMSLWAEV